MSALPEGSIAPDFTLSDREGETFSLADSLSDGPTMVTFYKVSCPTCQYGLPFLERLSRLAAEAGATSVAVCQDDPSDADRFEVEFGYETRALFDTLEAGFPASNAYGLTNVPTLFLVGQDGRIHHTMVSWSKSDIEEIAGKLGVPAPFQPGESVLPFRPG